MKIRLKEHSINIEVPENSKYLNLISINLPTINSNRKKKEEFLKMIYNICAKNVQYKNPIFFKNLIKSSKKKVELIVLNDFCSKEKDFLKQSYFLLNSSEKDSLHVVRTKYLKLAKIYHPDRVISKDVNLVKKHTHKFQEIHEAYKNIKYKIAS